VNTIYILGKKGFRYALSKQLSKTCKVCLPGVMLEFDANLECQLYWIPEDMTLHDFKKKIGSFHIFKYRLTFYESAEEYDKKGIERSKKDAVPSESDVKKNNQLSLEHFRKIGWGAGIKK
jgi:hypothetical protein